MPKTRTKAIAAKRIKRRTARKIPQEAPPAPTIASYEEALLESIIRLEGRTKSTEYPIMFNSVLSSFTPSIRSLYYRHGVSIGRELYRRYNSERRYIWYEEGIADLVSFLEKAGFNGITYNIFQDMIEINFNNRDRTFLGTHIHVFEAGMISGFLTAGKRQQVKIEEISCSNNGSDFCRFVTTNAPAQFESDSHYVLERFIDSVKPHLESAGAKASFAEEYTVLSSAVLTAQEYAGQMHRVIYYLGSEIGSRLKPLNRQRLEKLYKIIGMGELKANSMRPLSIRITFPTLKAKKEFVDISIAFLDALLKASMGNMAISTRHSKKKNSYILHIKETRK
jgi:predicted hydrocarbon binding protein